MNFTKKAAVLLLLIVLAICAGAASVSAKAANEEDFEYNNQNRTITGYLGAGGVVEIPSHIDNLPIAYVDKNAFSGNSTVTELIIPGNIDVIDAGAFSNMSNLTRVQIKNGTKTIEDGAFSSCPSLAEIVIPQSVKKIGEGVFSDDTGLIRIYFLGTEAPAAMGEELFAGITDETKILIPESVSDKQFAQFEARLRNSGMAKSVTVEKGAPIIIAVTASDLTAEEEEKPREPIKAWVWIVVFVGFLALLTALVVYVMGLMGIIGIKNMQTGKNRKNSGKSKT
ncbi:MAG: leucine-rich repeat domain-containing protein [Oscillospiraceae bacterium]|jgi:hypothetical protein|nr:leucine-rich repeat domain-containing protein [Oscillospiraceae bacterium]